MLEAAPPGERSVVETAAGLRERETELAALTAAIDRARRGEGGLLTIEGAPGIGKSSLLTEARAAAAAAGVTVLGARGSDLERGFPHGVTRQLFEPLLRERAAGRRERLLAGTAAQSRPLFEPDAPPAAIGADFGILDGLYWLTVGLAEEGPLMLCVDDAQWADAASLRYAGYLARRLQGVPALLCVAMRPPEPGPDANLLAGLVAEATSSRGALRPAPLSEEAAAELAFELLDADTDADDGFLSACGVASGGNPLLLRELCRGLREGGIAPTADRVGELERAGAAALAEIMRLRISQLPAAARELAGAAAVMGDRAAIGDAGALAGLSPERAFDALDALARADVLCRGQEVEFVHPLLRDAVLAGMAAGEVAGAHAEAARILAAAGRGPVRVAEQVLRAPPGGDPEWVATLRAAAGAALSAGNSAAAVAYLRRALEEPPTEPERMELMIALAQVETMVDSPAAIARMEEILGQIEDPGRRAAVSAALASQMPAWDPARTIELGRAALRDLGDAEPQLASRLEALVLTGELMVEEERPSPGMEPDIPTGEGPGERRLAYLIGYREARGGRLPAAAVVPAVRAAFAGEWMRYVEEAGSQYPFGMLVLIAADHRDVLEICDEWEAAGHRMGQLATCSGAKMFRAHGLLARGELEEAAAEAAEAVEMMEVYGMGGGVVAYAAAALADANLALGQLDVAAAAIERASRSAGNPSAVNLHGLHLSRARLRAARGDAGGALEEMLDLGRRFERIGGRNPALLPWRSEAALLVSADGDPARARALAAEEVELARAWGSPRALGRALRRAAAVADAAERAALLEEAVAVLEPSPARLELAETRLLQGITARARSPLEAREPLTQALALASACGAAPLERRAREELIAVGARPRRAAVTGPAALTRRERQVAELAANERSNREIAQELFLTKRTVETHLTRAYRKLEITSRVQLSEALNGEGPIVKGWS